MHVYSDHRSLVLILYITRGGLGGFRNGWDFCRGETCGGNLCVLLIQCNVSPISASFFNCDPLKTTLPNTTMSATLVATLKSTVALEITFPLNSMHAITSALRLYNAKHNATTLFSTINTALALAALKPLCRYSHAVSHVNSLSDSSYGRGH